MKVKVKKTRGTTGNQHNYGLVTGSIWNYEDKPTVNTLSTTLKPVDRDEANIEAEKNETIVYPDKDGMLAHSKIGGKRHRQGGTPLNVPDGSFVFSDFRGMNIKNKELLKNIFNMNTNKAVTPADIAKRYEINQYKQILQDPWADPMDKKTAQLMIENNMRKLGQLALIQEGMKGFPDGIPDIALPLMGSDIAQGEQLPQEEQQEQPPQAQKGKQVKSSKSSMSQADLDRYRLMMIQKAIAEGKGNMTLGEWENMYPKPKGEWREVNGKQVFSQDWIAPAEDRSWFDNAMLAATNPFATLMSIGDHSGNSWQSYVKEHNHNPIDMALNGVLAAYTLAPSAFASTPALLQSASQIKNMNNMRNIAALYEALGFSNNPVYNAPPKQMGGSFYLQNGGRPAPAPPGPPAEEKGLWDQFGDWWKGYEYKLPTIYGIGEGIYQGAKYFNPEFKRFSEWLAKLPIKQRLGKIAQLTKKATVGTPLGRIITMFGVNYALDYFFGDATEEEKAEAAKTLEQVAAEAKAKQDSSAGRIPDAYTGSGTDIYKFNPNQRSVVLDTPIVVTNKKDTVPIVRQPADSIKVTTSTNLQKRKPVQKPPVVYGPTSGEVDTNQSNWTVVPKQPKKQQLGGVTKYQEGGTKFDMKDQSLLDYANKKNQEDAEYDYEVVYPPYHPGTKDVGEQSPSKNAYYSYDTEGVLRGKDPWKNPTTGVEYKGIDDYINYADPYIDFSTYDADNNPFKGQAGKEAEAKQWAIKRYKEDTAKVNSDASKKAGEWETERVNAYNRSVLGDDAPLTVDPTIPTHYIHGQEKSNVQFYKKVPKKKQDKVEDNKTEKKDADTNSGEPYRPVYEQGVTPASWWNYDVVNYANQLGNYFDIEPGNLPVYQRYSPYIPDPTFLDPARAIAQQQGLTRQASDAIMSGADPTVGRANVIAAAANSANPVADIMAKYDQANVGIANEYGRNAAQMMNQAMLQNNQYNKTYTDELEVRRQQYQNALREGRTDVAKSIMQGMKNAAETSWMNATSDSYSVDPRTGMVYFKRGFDPRTGTYRGSGSERDTEYIDYLVKTKGWDRKDAIRYVTGKKSKKDDDDAQLGGMLYNPMDVIWNY